MTQRRPRRHRAVAGVLLAGCGGSPEPKSLPKPSPSTSASVSPTPPVMPATAKEKTKAGVVSFIRHYVALINYTQATGSTAQLASVETADCSTCAKSRGAVETLYQSGASVHGGDWSINSLNALRNPAIQEKR